MELDGKVAIVTGGAVRLGRAIAVSLAKAGARIILHFGSSIDSARSTAEEIGLLGGQVRTVQADLSEPVRASELIVAAAIGDFGQADVLVNNAAVFEAGDLATLTADSWERQMAINLASPAFLCRAFAARRRTECRAHIVNIADVRGLLPDPAHLAYSVGQAGLIALTQALAADLAPDVQVNAIAPGAILPPAGGAPEHFDALARRLPLGRAGSVEDVCRAVLFLLQSDFITGQVLQVDGGQHLPSWSGDTA